MGLRMVEGGEHKDISMIEKEARGTKSKVMSMTIPVNCPACKHMINFTLLFDTSFSSMVDIQTFLERHLQGVRVDIPKEGQVSV